MKNIGPSYRIISEYERKFIHRQQIGEKFYEGDDPIIVSRIRPDGYMILNGHHRWAAALRLGFKWIPVQIINTVGKQDIIEIISKSKHDKRVTFDLDEVVFYDGVNGQAEKPLPFPLNKLYKIRLRKGIPALFSMLNQGGYDIWLYSANFYNMDYIRALFHKYHVGVTGIVTGTVKRKQTQEEKNEMQELYSNKYKCTIHIDNDAVLMIDNVTKDFFDYSIEDKENWSKAVIDILKGFDV